MTLFSTKEASIVSVWVMLCRSWLLMALLVDFYECVKSIKAKLQGRNRQAACINHADKRLAKLENATIVFFSKRRVKHSKPCGEKYCFFAIGIK